MSSHRPYRWTTLFTLLSILLAAFVVGVAVLLLSLGQAGGAIDAVRALLALGLLAVVGLGTMLAASLWRGRRR